jgi:hypothetical protein
MSVKLRILIQLKPDPVSSTCQAELEKVRAADLERRQGNHLKKKVRDESKPAFLPGEVIDLTI